MKNDERANYQLDVKFQESYLNKVVSLLQCQLSEGAVSDKNAGVSDSECGVARSGSEPDEIEEGELPDSHGEHGAWLLKFFSAELLYMSMTQLFKFVNYPNNLKVIRCSFYVTWSM